MESRWNSGAWENYSGNLKEALRLYVIPDRLIGAPLSLEEQVRLALQGGATAIQLRDKSAEGKELLETAKRLANLCRQRDLCKRRGALFIVNDRLDVALLSGADGVHLGQSDLPVEEARRLAPRPFIVGASAHTVGEAEKAEKDGADYLGVGAVFETRSKDNAKVLGPEGLRRLTAAVRLPVVAIGGISLENLPEVMETGVTGVSVISAAVRGDVKERVTALRNCIEKLH
ncbi:MAG: thiamine phosphate synthase [Synergistaceae bacterium]|jgi:thiamine-phosphate pyrophosphorylase|nr:thiamine phosphate synthase [Synergistaceae bacterium]